MDSGLRDPQLTLSSLYASRMKNVANNKYQSTLLSSISQKCSILLAGKVLIQLTMKNSCHPPWLLSIIHSFHENKQGGVSYDGETSMPFTIQSGAKHVCVLAPTFFGVIFSMLLSFVFRHSEECVYLHTRIISKLFSLARTRTKFHGL